MNISTKSIKSRTKTAVVNVSHSVKSDMILPEYYDNIKKILKCSVRAYAESVTASEGKVSVAGCAVFSVLFCGENNNLYQYEKEEKFTKVISCPDVKDDDNIFIKQRASASSYRAVGAKRIEVSTEIHMEISAEKILSYDIIDECDCENIELRRITDNFFIPTCRVNRNFSLDKTFEIDNIGDTVEKFIRKDAIFRINEVKTAADKVFIRGICEITCLYLTEHTGKTGKYIFTDEFSEAIDAYGVEEDSVCSISCEADDVHMSIGNPDKNKCSVECIIKASVGVFSGKIYETVYSDDLNSLDCAAVPQFRTFELIKNVNTSVKKINVAFETESFDSGEICDCYADNVRLSFDKRNDNDINLLINAEYNILILKSDGEYTVISRNYLAEQKTDITFSDGVNVNADCTVLSINALHSADNKIKISAEYEVQYLSEENCNAELLVAIEENEQNRIRKGENITLYYANKGEKIWDIAKENHCRVDSIRAANDIPGEIIIKNQMLILPNF